MKENIIKLAKHPLIFGSTVIFVGSMAASVFNYLFNLALIRTLPVADYGTFSSLISIFNIFSVFSIVIIMIFSKFTASLVGQKREKAIGSLFISGTIWVGIMSFAVCVVLALGSGEIAGFLNINSIGLILLTILTLFFSFLLAVTTGILQGLLKFNYFSFINIASSLVKLLFGMLFIFLGYRVFGAISAFLLSAVLGYIFAIIPLYKFLKHKVEDGFTLSSLHKKAYSYAFPVLLSNIGITALISADIILVKHYFNPTVAGQYAALSLMGRSIFYLVSPISSVLFPVIAQKKERREKIIGTLLLSIFLVGFPAIILSAFYFAFPQVVLSVLSPGKIYLPLLNLLGPFSVFIMLYAMCFLLNSFYLSLGKTNVFIFTTIGAVLESILIVLYHASITEVINDLIVASFLLLISLLLYYQNVAKDSNS